MAKIYRKFADIPKEKFDLILCDPPHHYDGDPNKAQAAGKHYDLMTVDQMVEAFDVKSICKKPAVIFMWATGPKLHAAIELMQRWGFYYRGMSYIWLKTTQAGKLINGQGVRPSFVKSLAEFVIVGSTQAKGRPIKFANEASPQTNLTGELEALFAPRPGNKHSKKPYDLYEKLEDLFLPKMKKIELFCREPRDGWSAFGNEV